MRVAMCSDQAFPVHETVRQWLTSRGHEVVPFGAVATGEESSWALTAEAAAEAVAHGSCDHGVFFCWTGTGISIAANKVPGIRAALCSDAGQAAGARVWNHANVLCLSNRTLSGAIAEEILAAWFDTTDDGRGAAGVADLAVVEARHTRAGGGRLELATFVVRDYDEAIAFFTGVLGFTLTQDEPSLTNDGRAKRWVVVRPPGGGTGLLLAKADGAIQEARVGHQTGRVTFFLRVDDFDVALARLVDAGVELIGEVRDEDYGRVQVFVDLYGNRWDLLGPQPSA